MLEHREVKRITAPFSIDLGVDMESMPLEVVKRLCKLRPVRFDGPRDRLGAAVASTPHWRTLRPESGRRIRIPCLRCPWRTRRSRTPTVTTSFSTWVSMPRPPTASPLSELRMNESMSRYFPAIPSEEAARSGRDSRHLLPSCAGRDRTPPQIEFGPSVSAVAGWGTSRASAPLNLTAAGSAVWSTPARPLRQTSVAPSHPAVILRASAHVPLPSGSSKTCTSSCASATANSSPSLVP